MSEKIAKYSWGAESRGIPVLDMLWEALKPFPGRALLTLRLAIICTAIVLGRADCHCRSRTLRSEGGRAQARHSPSAQRPQLDDFSRKEGVAIPPGVHGPTVRWP